VAQPVLEFLTGRARQALPYLRAAAAQGLSANAAIAALKAIPIALQRQKALDIYGVLLSRVSPERIIRLVGETTPIPIEFHSPAVRDQFSNYQYVVSTPNQLTDELAYLTVSSAVPLAGAEIRELGQQAFEGVGDSSIAGGFIEGQNITINEANIGGQVPRP
jgi:hypothetical protein